MRIEALLAVSLATTLVGCKAPAGNSADGSTHGAAPHVPDCSATSVDLIGCGCSATASATKKCWPGDPSKRNTGT